MSSLHGQLYEALSNYNVALKQVGQLNSELAGAMETLSRRIETLINLVHKIECPHPPDPARVEAVDKHYGVSWKDMAKSYSPGVPRTHVVQCGGCGQTFEVTNPEKLTEVHGLCQKCWKNTLAT